MAAKFGGSLKCTVCAKSVYPQEKVGIEKVIVHKTCFKCSTCNTTLNVGNYHVVEDKLLCKNHYQQSFAHKAPSADVKSTTPRGTTPTPTPTPSSADTKKQEEEKKRAEDEQKKKAEQAARAEAEKKKAEADKKQLEAAKQSAKPATAAPAKVAASTTTPVKPAATPAPKADDSKALESLKQFSAALDKLEHALTAVERRL